MEQKSMTALLSAFSRAYHAQNKGIKIFNDSIAKKLLTDEEYYRISKSISDGIGFFNPDFTGDSKEALRWIVDNQLSPAPLGRAAFAEQSLKRAAKIGAGQYLIFGAGYDSFAYRQPAWAERLKIFEIDHPATSADKQKRLKAANCIIPDNVHFVEADFTKKAWQISLINNKAFDNNKISCGTLLGVVYYLSRQTFEALIAVISEILPKGSSIIFDYPDEESYTDKAGERAKKQTLLARAANEKMQVGYSYCDMEQLLSKYNFLIYEHLTPMQITKQYFEDYNRANPKHKLTAFDNVNYCLAVIK